MDCNTKTFSLTERNALSALSAYKQIYDKKNKQTQQNIMDILG